ncbi:MAG: MFS transporter [Chloroflexia bacterium]|nr:MFS transporter [Chloroflexia bacterium]
MAAPTKAAPATEEHASAQRALWLLIAAIFVVSLDSRVITPLLPAIAEEFDASIGRAGLIVTAYLLPYGLFQLLYGPLADRVGRVRVISIALGAFALGAGLCALAPDLNSLVGLRLVTGVAAAAVFPLTLTYIGDTVAYDRRQEAIGYTIMAASLGQVLSSAIGGFLAAAFSWRVIFAIDGLVALVITIAILRQPLTRVRPAGLSRSAAATYRVVLADRRHILFYILIFVEGAVTLGAFAYFGALLRDRDGFSFTAIGILVAIFGLGSLVFGRIVGRVARKIGERRMIAFGGAGVVVGYGITTLQPAIILFPIAMVLMGSTFMMMHSTLQTRATELAPTARATGISLFAFALFLGSSLGAFLTAQSIDRLGYNETMLALGAATAIFTAIMTVVILRFTEPYIEEVQAC